MAAPYISEVRLFATDQTPDGWVPCDGRLLRIQEHQALYALVGNTFGGDERQGTFAVPDLTDRVPLGSSGKRPLGSTGGAVDHKLSVDELAAHAHEVAGEDVSPTSAGGHQPASDRVPSNSNQRLYGPAEQLVDMHPEAISAAGSFKPHPNEQPYLTLGFYMATHGLFPSRG